MRRTVWGVLLTLIVLAAFMQAFTVVEGRPEEEITGTRVQADGRVVTVRTMAPRLAAASNSDRRRTWSGRRSNQPTVEEREAVIWTGHVVSSPFAKSDTDAAYKDALDRARDRIEKELRLPMKPPRDFIRKFVEKKYTPAAGPTDNLIGETQTVQLDLEVSGEAWLQLAQMERGMRVQDRLEGLIRLSAIATALLACIAGYIRLDEYTKGYYTGRLRLLAIAIALGATAAASIG